MTAFVWGTHLRRVRWVLSSGDCTHIREGDATRELGEEARRDWEQVDDELAADGLRVLALADKIVEHRGAEAYEQLRFLGYIGLLDPPRTDVRDVLEECRQAGIRLVMVTGDHPATARHVAQRVGLEAVTCIPVSALKGDNISRRSEAMPWFKGPSLLEQLETAELADEAQNRPFRLPVQWVNRPNLDFRGYAGTVQGGTVRVGDAVAVLPSGKTSRVERIVTMDGDLEAAHSGQAVTLTLADEIDVSRGDVIAPAQDRPIVADQVHAHLIWMDEREMLPGRSYLIHLGTAFVGGQINRIKHTVNVNTLEETAASHLELNDVAVCDVAFDRPVPFDPYAENPATGAFIVIDRMTNATVGAGMIDYALRRATNVHWHDTRIDKAARAQVKAQRPCVLWFTGLSGAGKSVVSDLVEQRLAAMGKHTMMLDGDNVRHGLNRDLGFTDEDRVENIRRVAEVSRLMTEAGLITLVSFISPFRSERRMAREMLGEGEFLEVFVDAPLAVCEQRDPKGLYKKARAGEIPNFTGIGSAYEPPEAPELHLRSDQASPEDLAGQVIGLLEARGML